jgi:Domain of unknown function (DUF4389)
MSQPPSYDYTPSYGQVAGSFPPGYEPPGPPGFGRPAGAPADGPSPILVGFPAPGKQRRVTVLFRIVLVIPHFVVLYAIGIAAQVVAFIGWFAALFTGQLPEWAHTFLTGTLRWQVRAYAYMYLLTDTYPPFSLDDDGYPIRLLSRATTLNRLAVFFRIVLAIPAAIVAGAAGFGLVVISFFGGLIALVTGQVPAALHEAMAAIVRYTTRYTGFVLMISSEYPKGLYGDSPAAAVVSAEADPLAQSEPQPALDPWRLMLSSAAKSLVTVSIVVGVLGAIAYAILIAVAVGNGVSTATNAFALTQVQQANNVLDTSMLAFPSAVGSCNGQLTCVTALDRKLAGSLETFATTVRGMDFSGSASSDANNLVSDTGAAAQDLSQLGAATTVAQYQALASSGALQQDLDKVSTDYVKLAKDLGAR